MYFIGFTREKGQDPVNYICRAVVINPPSPFTKAPHRVKVTGVALSKFHTGGSEENGRSLLYKEMNIPIDRLSREVPPFLTPEAWWG